MYKVEIIATGPDKPFEVAYIYADSIDTIAKFVEEMLSREIESPDGEVLWLDANIQKLVSSAGSKNTEKFKVTGRAQ